MNDPAHQVPNAVICKAVRMKVSTGVAGTYTARIKVPAHSLILNLGLHAVALWNAGTSATGIVGDAADPDGFFTAIDLKATDLLAGEGISLWDHGGKPGAYIVGTLPTGHWETRYSTSERLLAFENILLGDAATTGETIFWVEYVVLTGAAQAPVVLA